MHALLVTALCSFVVLGSARERRFEVECCKNIKRFPECKRECEKIRNERKSAKLVLALSLPNVCPSHLVSLWKCLNSTIAGFHLYADSNLLSGKSCCLLGIDASCRKACFSSSNTKVVRQFCPQTEENSLLGCIERDAASKRCCKATRKKCEKACQIVFASKEQPSRKKIRTVKRRCGRKNRHVFDCVNSITSSLKSPDHPCCQKTSHKNCQKVCREAMASKTLGAESKISLLQKACKMPLYNTFWTCFFAHSKPMESDGPQQVPKAPTVDVRLHCCVRAKSPECLGLCLKAYSGAGETDDQFNRKCEFNPSESKMLTCIADVSRPCHIGCTGLGFCTNFNNRHTEFFRSCNKEKDDAAKFDYKNWWKKGKVEIHSMDVVPVKDIRTCLPEMWKAVACILQIRPCHARSHGSAICRKDCLKVLGDCAEKEQLGIRTVEEMCDKLSPDDQASCISLSTYMSPSLYQNETVNVTHPCNPNLCPERDVCEVNRENSQKFSSFRCSPGCPVDHQSKTVIKNGDFARLPIVQNSKLEGCFKICRCEQGRLSDCPPLPNCVKERPCYHRKSNKSYKHQERFYLDCNFCVCFDGELTCSKTRCDRGTVNNSTGRLRRNHFPTNESAIPGVSCSCDAKYDPVCGSNGKTYRNFCFASCGHLHANQIVKGPCTSLDPCRNSPCGHKKVCVVDRKVCVGSNSCPQYICIAKTQNCYNASSEAICDTMNNQYVNKCLLQQSGKEVAYYGECKRSCAPDRKRVCGIDGRTYSSTCALEHARMLMDYEGPCKTVGTFADEEATARCASIKCPILKPANCVGITPPGACCKVCATLLIVLFSEEELAKTNTIVMDKSQPITQQQVVSRVRRHLSVGECDVFGFYRTYGNFVFLVKAITENPTKLQFLICNKEAQKIETSVHTASPIFTSDEILSTFRAVLSSTPRLSDKTPSAVGSCSASLLLTLLLTIAVSSLR